MIRLFTGIEIPAEIKTGVFELCGGLHNARWIESEDFHLTLQFAGNIDEVTANELHDALTRIRKSPVEIILEGLRAFGGDKPRSLVVVARATPSLVDLQATHERTFRRIGIKFDARKFVPHITIARLKATGPVEVASYINSRGYIRPRTFMADHFSLYSSAKSSGGGPYQVEAEYQLRE